MGKKKCFVKGCPFASTKKSINENVSNNVGQPHFFRVSQDESLLIWQTAIPGGEAFTKNHHICEMHFKSEEVIKQFVHDKLVGGTTFVLDRAKVSLKKGSVPSIFPNNDGGAKTISTKPTIKKIDCVNIINKGDSATTLQEQSLGNLNSVEVEATNNFLNDVDEQPKSSGLTHSEEIIGVFVNDSSAIKQSEENIEMTAKSTESAQVFCNQTEGCFDDTLHDGPLQIPMQVDINLESKHTDEIVPLELRETDDFLQENALLNNPTNTFLDKSQFIKVCDEIINSSQSSSLPADWVPQVILTGVQCIMWAQWKQGYTEILKRIVLFSDMKVEVYIGETLVDLSYDKDIKSMTDIEQLIKFVNNSVTSCQKIDGVNRSDKCCGFVVKRPFSPGPKIMRCPSCKIARLSWQKRREKKKKILVDREKHQQMVTLCRNLKRKSERQKLKINRLKMKVAFLKNACAKANDEAIAKACASLPENQKFNVQACFNASKVKDSRGVRYANQWIYECLMLRIKSKATYQHLRKNNIMALPSITTLNHYLKQIKGTYGFNESTFDLLSKKTATMDPSDVRGVLLVDEMKLAETVSFNRQQLKFEGFTDLGKYTPEHQKKLKGDHALVIMFQPFKGKWVQTLGCFLSRGSATGTVLHQILIEATILAERAGLKVDGITSDGASWNRKMWDIFGVNEENISIEHIVDPERRLWFFSDFPHLIKCLRNFFSKQNKYDNIWTPDGTISLKHWYALIALENPKGFNLKVNYKLREEHIKPQYYQKMNVAMAFQFFGQADTMELFKAEHSDLNDCEGSVKFCTRVHNLIKAMNSRTPIDNLKPDNNMWKSIEEFITFLEEWEKEAKQKGYEFMPDGTCYGLKISLKSALQICKFLIDDCNFKYLMTARLNQDNLERFFGMMRYCCGSNDHPDSLLFIQMYKLISTYSLVKPPKGSNVTGDQIVKVLLSMKEVVTDAHERRQQWDDQIDTILDRALNTEVLTDAASILEDHEYFKCTTSDYVIAYMSGFVARKSKRFAQYRTSSNRKVRATTCEHCMETVSLKSGEEVPEHYKLIEMRNRGALFKPSIPLFSLISKLEKCVLDVIGKNTINSETIFDVTNAVDNLSSLPLVGCEKHQQFFTRKVITFYLTTRMFFAAKQSNKNNNIQREHAREKRKLAKLGNNTPASDDVTLNEERTDEIKTNKSATKRKASSTKASSVIKKKKTQKIVSNKAASKRKMSTSQAPRDSKKQKIN